MDSAIVFGALALCATLPIAGQAPHLTEGLAERNISVGVNGPQQPAVAFTLPAQEYRVESVTLNLRDYTSASDTPVISFYTDKNGQPGTLHGLPLRNPFSDSNRSANFTFVPNGLLTLGPNATFWMLVSSSNGSFYWNTTENSAASTRLPPGAWFSGYKVGLNYGQVYVEDSPVPAFSIAATAVPEPSMYSLIGLGLLGFTLVKRAARVH